MTLRDTVESTPVVDNHAHAVKPLPEGTTPETFAGYFTEGPGVEQARHTIYYRVGVQFLRERFDGETESELLEQRLNVDLERYSRDLHAEANISHICQDTGVPAESTPEDFARYTDAEVRPILRVENHVEEIIDAEDNFTDFERRLIDRLEEALAGSHVGLKSIIAYRTGLDITDPTRSEAAKAFHEVKPDWDGRIEHPVLLDYVANRTAEIAAEYDAPVQFHSGFGDPDAHPLFVDPGYMYEFLQSHPDTDFVLLHASYPYARKAGYIVSVLENAYLDLGMTIPFVQHGVANLLRQVLELGPSTKLMYSSDGYVVPEWHYLGAKRMRADLTTVLEDLVEGGFVSEAYAETMAVNVLRGNAERVYDL